MRNFTISWANSFANVVFVFCPSFSLILDCKIFNDPINIRSTYQLRIFTKCHKLRSFHLTPLDATDRNFPVITITLKVTIVATKVDTFKLSLILKFQNRDRIWNFNSTVEAHEYFTFAAFLFPLFVSMGAENF